MKAKDMILRLTTAGIAQIKKLARNLNSSDGTLSQRAVRGGFWVFSSYGGGKLLGFIRSVILARLLLPSDFGLMGLAAVATGFLTVITEVGTGQALIHKQDDSDDMLNTAWTLTLLRSTTLCALTFLTAGPVAALFETPALAPILRVMSFLFVISGLENIGLILLKKELDFRTLAYFDFASNVLSLVAVIIAALILRNAWALVLGSLFQALIALVGSYVIHPFRPRLTWRPQTVRVLLNYGKYIFGGGIVRYFLTQGDDALVGKVLGTAQLGFYGMAYNVSNMPATSITHIIARVAFPAYAKLQNDIPSLRHAYLRMLKFIGLLAVPVSGGLLAVAPELVHVLYGEKWLPMIPSFMILCIYGLERAINASVGPLFQATGRPQVVFYLNLFKLILLALIIYPFTIRYGIMGTSIASTLVAIIISMNATFSVAKTLQCSISSVLKPLFGPFAATGIMISSLFLVKLSGRFGANLFSLMALVIIGVLVYILSLYALDRSTVYEIKELIRLQFKSTEAPVQQISEASV